MSWDYQRALERAYRRYADVGEITVEPVGREIDFGAVTLKRPRQLRGAQAYVDIINFRGAVGEGAASRDVTRAMHLYGREVTRVVEADFDAAKVHLQGPKLHFVAYRPINDDPAKVVAATLASAAVVKALRLVSEVLDLQPRWMGAAGVDFGEVLVTKDGVAGDRELLFLGSAANRPAKIIQQDLLLTVEAANLLPHSLGELLVEEGDLWRLSLTGEELDKVVHEHGFAWSRERSRDRVEADAKAIRADAVRVVAVTTAIDKDTLSLSNSKAVDAVSLFADVDGFTAFIEEAERHGTLEEAVRSFHVQRSELRDVLATDFDGLRVQYQGDRMQGVVYQPIGSAEDVVLKAVRVAAALASAASGVLPQVIGAAAKPLAIGLAYGPVVISKLGERGNRDVVSLGQSTAEAARIQQALPGGSIGINRALRELLPGWLQDVFTWDTESRSWVANQLVADELERLEASESPSFAKSLLGVAAGVAVGAAAAAAADAVARRTPASTRQADASPPLRPWLPD